MTDVPATRVPAGTEEPGGGEVIGSVRLPAELSSGPAARRFAVSQLPQLAQDDRDTLALLVAELVTNSLLHARSGVELTLTLRPERNVLLVEVADDDPRLPTRHHHGDDASTGRGMHLVDALSSDWGAIPRPGGKTVWFELALTRPSR